MRRQIASRSRSRLSSSRTETATTSMSVDDAGSAVSTSSDFVSARSAGFSMPAAATSARTTSSVGGRLVGRVAEDDAVGVAEHAEERSAAAPVLVRTLDQAGDLDELHQHPADPRQRRHGPERREGVVARLDLDLRQRLQQRGLAGVRRSRRRRSAPLPRAVPGSSRGAGPFRARASARALPRATCAGRRRARCGSPGSSSMSARMVATRSDPSFPTRRRFATSANVRCGIGIASSFRSCGKEHAGGSRRPTDARPRPVPPLPWTPVPEAAAQPF